jgi:hypothetical protein
MRALPGLIQSLLFTAGLTPASGYTAVGAGRDPPSLFGEYDIISLRPINLDTARTAERAYKETRKWTRRNQHPITGPTLRHI